MLKFPFEHFKVKKELSLPAFKPTWMRSPKHSLSPCSPVSPPHRKEPVGGENDALEIKERKNKIEDNADATTSLPGCLGQKDHDALLAMRDQARLVSTAIQLLTSPELNCLSSSPSIYHKVCSNEAAEPCDLEKPHSQVRVRVRCSSTMPSRGNQRVS